MYFESNSIQIFLGCLRPSTFGLDALHDEVERRLFSMEFFGLCDETREGWFPLFPCILRQAFSYSDKLLKLGFSFVDKQPSLSTIKCVPLLFKITLGCGVLNLTPLTRIAMSALAGYVFVRMANNEGR